MATAADTGRTTDPHGARSSVVVDIGKKPRKQIRQLRKGRGKLLDEVNGLIEEMRVAGSISATAQPVVVVVRQRRKTRALLWPLA